MVADFLVVGICCSEIDVSFIYRTRAAEMAVGLRNRPAGELYAGLKGC
jgi:hypothetical protein